ncbi:hypothetical protein NW762_013486 [Fusarium torreyae]|uniref:Uncharacterized protein n=1 Tax=Fusarium torreyae TaxID=1237075 RepID=A0A9W8RLV9_9HYPO|nr:hypothetical protein NW762_013486 [Fusarium torreyae]
MTGGKRPSSESSSSSHKAPKNTNIDTPNKVSTKHGDAVTYDDSISISDCRIVLQSQGFISRDESQDEVPVIPGDKGDFTDDDYKSLVHTAFRFIGRDASKHAQLVKATVDWMKSTKFFATKTWSCWTGEKKLCELLKKCDSAVRFHKTHVYTPTAKFTIPAFIMLHLMRDVKFQPTDESFKLLERHKIFRHLGGAIDLWKPQSDEMGFITLGLRPDAKPIPDIRVARLEPILPGPATCDLSNSMLLAPYPRSSRSVTLRRRMTSEEWVALNQDWLAKLGDRRFDNAAFKDKIAKQVTSDTAPLIPEEYRNKLWCWFGEFNKAGRSIIDVDFQPSVEVKSKVEDSIHPEHPVERSLRRIEDVVGKLPGMCSEAAASIKYELNRLFAYHEAQNADNVRFKDEVMRASRKLVDMTDKLPVVQSAEGKQQGTTRQIKNIWY